MWGRLSSPPFGRFGMAGWKACPTHSLDLHQSTVVVPGSYKDFAPASDWAFRTSQVGQIPGATNRTNRVTRSIMEPRLLNIGFGNTVVINRIVAIVSPASAPMKRLKEDAKQANKLVDATMGRRTRSIIITDSDHVILSGVQAETIAQRLLSENHPKDGNLAKQEKE
jgi:extracellular matrix regulatory protein A